MQFQELEAQFTAEYLPATPTERSLVDSLIHSEWMLRRFRWIESEVWRAARSKCGEERATWGMAFLEEPSLSRLYRLRNSTQRAFHETLAELRRVQAARQPELSPPPPAEPPGPQPQPAEIKPDSPEIGFVPSTAGPHPSAPSPIEQHQSCRTAEYGFARLSGNRDAIS